MYCSQNNYLLVRSEITNLARRFYFNIKQRIFEFAVLLKVSRKVSTTENKSKTVSTKISKIKKVSKTVSKFRKVSETICKTLERLEI